METLTKDVNYISSTHPHVTYYLGDVHEGAANMDEKAFRRAVSLIEKDGDLWVGIGDYVDCITVSDPRFNPQEIADKYSVKDLEDLPRKQSDYFLANIASISNKCAGLIYGNHEDSYRHHNSFDVVSYMCSAMGVPNLRHKAWLSLNFKMSAGTSKSIPVRMVACHGAGGGGMREGYPINKVHDTFRWDIADVHVQGHLHQMHTDRAIFNSYEYGIIRQSPVWFGVNGCFLLKSTVGNDGYFEQRPGKESSIGLLKQIIYPHSSSKAGFEIRLEKIFL